MKNQGFTQLFIDELEDMYSSEHQMIEALPNMIKAASSDELKEALTNHLKETKNQVTRLNKIFSIMGLQPSENTCEAMEGLIQEAKELIGKKSKSPLLDAAIISAAQKIEHYEIASYGTLRSFAKNLELNSEIATLLQKTLDEEGAADKKLTKIADGSLFSAGINQQAAETMATRANRR